MAIEDLAGALTDPAKREQLINDLVAGGIAPPPMESLNEFKQAMMPQQPQVPQKAVQAAPMPLPQVPVRPTTNMQANPAAQKPVVNQNG